MRLGLKFLLALALVAVAGPAGDAQPRQERIVGLPCEGCEAVFQGLPAQMLADAQLAPPGEPGEPLVLEGIVRGANGQPVAGTIVYAYQTNARGVYPPAERFAGQAAYRHGLLRGWARTGPDGRYRFRTVRPASYPNTRIAQHVHMHVIEPGRCTYFIDEVQFEDDPYLTSRERARAEGRGGPAVVLPSRAADGTWHARRDIVLGARVPGYAQCGS